MRNTGASRTPNNPLLVRDSVGKPRPTVFDLPGPRHVYGKQVERDPEETAAQVLQHWNVKATSQHAIPALDYITMNRNTVRQKIIEPQKIREYRKAHPVRIKIGDNAGSPRKNVSASSSVASARGGETSAEIRKQRLIGPLPSDSNPEFTYGKPTRPSTPVKKLMTDVYQAEWVEEQEKRERERERIDKEKSIRKQTKTVTPAKRPLPKKVLLVEKDPKSLFKLSKFKMVESKIDCRRTSPINSISKGNAIAAPAEPPASTSIVTDDTSGNENKAVRFSSGCARTTAALPGSGPSKAASL